VRDIPYSKYLFSVSSDVHDPFQPSEGV